MSLALSSCLDSTSLFCSEILLWGVFAVLMIDPMAPARCRERLGVTMDKVVVVGYPLMLRIHADVVL